jgi:hypothetical protein
MTKKIAVVLRGPMGVGKSTVADQVCRLLNAGAKIVLDDHYEARGRERDALFTGRQNDALVIELGCGEPLDLTFNGFTRDAEAWCGLLRQAGREVYFFKLWADWATVHQNMASRRSSHLLSATLWHRAYSTGLDIVTLPSPLRGLEQTINVDSKSPTQVAEEIVAAIRAPA